MTGKFVVAAHLAGAFAIFAMQQPAQAQNFYQGKTLQVVVGSSPGGGFDLYGRTLARHLPKHIPGSPTIIVQNVPTAGGLTAVMNLDATQPKDGTVITEFNPGLIIDSLLSPERIPVRFSNFTWVGSITSEVRVCYAWGASGVKNWNDLKSAKQFVLGASGKGTGNYAIGSTLEREFKLPIKQVTGYPGSSDIRLAIERREIDGDCGAWSSVPEAWKRDNKINPLARFNKDKGKDTPDVPWISEFATTQDTRDIVQILGAADEIARPFIMSKQVPADRVVIIRKAFDDTMKDPEFLADMEKQKLSVTPTSGDNLQQVADRITNIPPNLVTKVKQLFE